MKRSILLLAASFALTSCGISKDGLNGPNSAGSGSSTASTIKGIPITSALPDAPESYKDEDGKVKLCHNGHIIVVASCGYLNGHIHHSEDRVIESSYPGKHGEVCPEMEDDEKETPDNA